MRRNLLLFLDSDIVNMVSVDIAILQKAARFLHLPWACPLQLLLSVFYLYSILGISIVPGKDMDTEKIRKNATQLLFTKLTLEHMAPVGAFFSSLAFW